MKKKEKDLKGYFLDPSNVLGRGQYGTVYKGYKANTKEIVAIKQIKTINYSSKDIKSLDFEAGILMKLRCDNIIRVYDLRVFSLITIENHFNLVHDNGVLWRRRFGFFFKKI
jgi:serine/threonine protein kinase